DRGSASSMRAAAPPAPALATGTSPIRSSVIATEERDVPAGDEPEPVLAPIEPLSVESAAVAADTDAHGLFGGTLPPVEAHAEEGSSASDRYVPLASGYRSFQTRVLGFVGLAILIALLAVA